MCYWKLKMGMAMGLFMIAVLVPLDGNCTSPVSPSIEYYGIDRQSLITLHEEEYARVGLVLGTEVERLDENNSEVKLSFDYVQNSSVRLKNAIELRLVSQGPEAARCELWPCTTLNPIIRTADPKLASVIWSAYERATANIRGQVLERDAFVKEQN